MPRFCRMSYKDLGILLQCTNMHIFCIHSCHKRFFFQLSMCWYYNILQNCTLLHLPSSGINQKGITKLAKTSKNGKLHLFCSGFLCYITKFQVDGKSTFCFDGKIFRQLDERIEFLFGHKSMICVVISSTILLWRFGNVQLDYVWILARYAYWEKKCLWGRWLSVLTL